jgi:PAS domain S-box-containing protein
MERLTIERIRKYSFAIAAGLAAFLLSAHDISYVVSETQINIPWSLILPITISLAYGRKAALLTALSGGALYPFYLWPEDGYTNLMTFLLITILYILLGYYTDIKKTKISKRKLYLNSIIIIFFYIVLFLISYLFLFNVLLNFNPPFWVDKTLTNLPFNLLSTFAVKDLINYALIIQFSETLIRIPFVRRILGLSIQAKMQQNGKAFLLSISSALTIWLLLFWLNHLIVAQQITPTKEYMHLSFIVIFWSSGLIARILINYLESKIATEEMLRKSEEQLRTLITNVPSVIYRCLLDKYWTMKMISPQIQELAGYKATDFLNNNLRTYSSVIHPDDREFVNNSIQAQIKNSRKFEIEYRIIDSFGKIHWVNDKGSTHSGISVNENYIDGVIDDFTSKKLIEIEIEKYKNHLEELVEERTQKLQTLNQELILAMNELKASQARMIQSEKMASLGVLTAGIAHEINNPLNFIYGAYSALKEYFNDNNIEQDNYIPVLLNGIQTGIERAASIVQGLNQFSRDKNDLDENCDIHSILDNCLLMLNYELKDRIKLEKNYSPNLPRIIGNIGKLHQVFINILSNALQAISAEGFIKIKTHSTENSIQIEIEDSGCGISIENISKIMDPFFTTKDPDKGTGLGLSISYSIIKEHNGSINFVSEINKGTTVYIEFPTKI